MLRLCNNYFNKSTEATRHSLKNDSGFALMVFRLISFFKTAQPVIKHGVSESKYFEQIPRSETYIITLTSNVNLKCQHIWCFFKSVFVFVLYSLVHEACLKFRDFAKWKKKLSACTKRVLKAFRNLKPNTKLTLL